MWTPYKFDIAPSEPELFSMLILYALVITLDWTVESILVWIADADVIVVPLVFSTLLKRPI